MLSLELTLLSGNGNSEVPAWVSKDPSDPKQREYHESKELQGNLLVLPAISANLGTKGCITEITATTGMFVESIEFKLYSGIQQVHGSQDGGTKIEVFTLDKDEAVLEVTQTETHEYLAQKLVFTTSKGRNLGATGYGGPGKEPREHKFVSPEGKQICGLAVEGIQLRGVLMQSRTRRGSRKHPQRLAKHFMKGRKSKS